MPLTSLIVLLLVALLARIGVNELVSVIMRVLDRQRQFSKHSKGIEHETL